MFAIARIIRKVAAGGLLAGLCLAGGALSAAPPASAGSPAPLPNGVIPEASGEEKAAPPAVEAGPACAAPGCSGGFDWSKKPETRPLPRPGNFFIFPSGPGYYSALDMVEGNCRENPPKLPYSPISIMPGSFFDADFRYLDDPANTQHDWLDAIHRIHLGDDLMLNTGGEFRWRHMDEGNARLGPKRNNYDLYRVREYADLWYKDFFRVYVEGIYATSVGQDLAPLPIDINKGDFQNLFIDLKLACIDGHNAYLRVGRQEMLLGSQRLISPLDWANTRRTFQGARAFYQGDKFDVDAFWVQPVKVQPNKLDSADNNQNFAGIWTTYRPEKGTFLDAYYLYLDNTNVVTQQAIVRAPYSVHTFGTRYAGDKDGFLWDAEAAMQLGERGKEQIIAGMASGGIGYNFKNLPMNPTVWAYYDWASGDANPNQGDFDTFNQLFPFGHYYFGFADQVGRQNIRDANAHLYMYPTKWITLNLQYHHFTLDQSRDALYNAGGNAIRRSATGKAGNDVGDEFDFVTNLHLDAHSDIFFGYSKLFGGNFLENSGNKVKNTDLLYLQYSFRW